MSVLIMPWVIFKRKIGIKGYDDELMNNLKATEGIDIRYVHCDNAGKNKAFERQCKDKGMGLNLNTPCSGLHNKMVTLN